METLAEGQNHLGCWAPGPDAHPTAQNDPLTIVLNRHTHIKCSLVGETE